MPIQKSKTLLNGLTGDFWVIDNVSLSADLAGVRAMAKLYPSQADFVTGAGAIFQGDIVLTQSDNPLNANELINLIENKLVTLPGEFLSGIAI